MNESVRGQETATGRWDGIDFEAIGVGALERRGLSPADISSLTPRLTAFAYTQPYRVPSWFDVEDMVSIALFEVHRAIGTFVPGRGDFWPWVVAKAYRGWSHELANHTPEPVLVGDVADHDVADSITSISTRVAKSEGFQKFREFLAGLAGEDGRLAAFLIEGLSFTEIACNLGIGEDAARQRAARLRTRLRAAEIDRRFFGGI